MRIAIVHSFYSSAAPSGENIVVEMQVEALRQAGHDVELIAEHTDALSQENLYTARSAINVMTGGGKSPVERLTAFKPDVVHVHNLFPNFSTTWLKKWEGPVVATMHNFRPICSNGLLFRNGNPCTKCPDHGHHNAIKHACYRDSRIATLPIAIRNRKGADGDPVLQNAHTLIALSERSRNTYIRYGIDAESITVVPNYINTYGAPRIEHSARETWIYAGRLSPEKGILDLVHRWPHSERLLILGAGEDEEHIKAVAYKNKAIVLGGSIPREQLLELLPKARGVVIPSMCPENLPTIYLEALAAGVPVIARKGNAAADDIETWAPGCTYSNTSELIRSLQNANRIHYERRNAPTNRFKENFTKEQWIRRIQCVYDSSLNGAPK